MRLLTRAGWFAAHCGWLFSLVPFSSSSPSSRPCRFSRRKTPMTRIRRTSPTATIRCLRPCAPLGFCPAWPQDAPRNSHSAISAALGSAGVETDSRRACVTAAARRGARRRHGEKYCQGLASDSCLSRPPAVNPHCKCVVCCVVCCPAIVTRICIRENVSSPEVVSRESPCV